MVAELNDLLVPHIGFSQLWHKVDRFAHDIRAKTAAVNQSQFSLLSVRIGSSRTISQTPNDRLNISDRCIHIPIDAQHAPVETVGSNVSDKDSWIKKVVIEHKLDHTSSGVCLWN